MDSLNDKKKWYVIHAVAGTEQQIKRDINAKAESIGMSDMIGEIIIPCVKVDSLKGGKKIQIEKKVLAGYMFIEALMSEDVWHLILSIGNVMRFIGSAKKPREVPDREIQNVLQQMEKAYITMSNIAFNIGDHVKIIDGPFDSFFGNIEDIDESKNKFKVSVSIFGRPTTIDLKFDQVLKV